MVDILPEGKSEEVLDEKAVGEANQVQSDPSSSVHRQIWGQRRQQALEDMRNFQSESGIHTCAEEAWADRENSTD